MDIRTIKGTTVPPPWLLAHKAQGRRLQGASYCQNIVARHPLSLPAYILPCLKQKVMDDAIGDDCGSGRILNIHNFTFLPLLRRDSKSGAHWDLNPGPPPVPL